MKTLPISVSASGDTALLAAPANPKVYYRVFKVRASAAGAVSMKFKSGSTDLTGAMPMVTGTPFISGEIIPTFSGLAKEFDTAPGEALNINLSAAVAVGGWLVYQELLS